jgi:predicted ATPase
MRVDRLQLKDFTVFGEANIEFSPGLNVFIGANGTGKSHLLKLLYSATRSIAVAGPLVRDNPEWNTGELLGVPMLQAVERNFRPEPRQSVLGGLIRRGADTANVGVHGDFGSAIVRMDGRGERADFPAFRLPDGHAVFVPANEVLSMYPGFAAAYERRELSFDGTFRDLCLDLSASPLRSVAAVVLAELAGTLDDVVGGKTVFRGDRFYVSLSEEWQLEAPMLAEGLRKLASVAHLIRNGCIEERGVLFWDEPEANMNPRLIPTVAHTLLALASAGVQVFVATHDFLLSNELSLAAEYQTEGGKAAKTRFFCLSHDGAGLPVRVASGATLAEIPENPILEEFAAHYDRERNLFYAQGSLPTPEPTK